jgi:serine/threonine protein kinase
MDLFNSYTFGSQPTMTKQCIPEADPHQNLIRLLQVAQSLKVTILPLTYNPGLEVLGLDGATSAVNQSELSPQTEFAFKRFRAESLDPDMTEEKFREMQYNAMIAEVTILGCQAIRSHPNIVTFIGLGFEVARCGEQIWPALVFSKAQHGDLSKFVSESESLGIDVLLSICGEVAKGLQTMHSYGKLGHAETVRLVLN